MQKGQIVYASGSCGVVLDVFVGEDGKRVYKINFAKNAVRLQPPEIQAEENLVGLRLATQEELDAEINGLKGMISSRLKELQAAVATPIPVSIPLPTQKPSR
ncbi:MAG: hypothetical protein ACOYYS_18710 [Chloroflexota bacterium]